MELQYLHEYAGISTSIGLTASPIVNFSGVAGNNMVAIGTDLSFDTATGNFTKCNAGISLSTADLIASMTLWVVSFIRKGEEKRNKNFNNMYTFDHFLWNPHLFSLCLVGPFGSG